jgi:hypothetical protein
LQGFEGGSTTFLNSYGCDDGGEEVVPRTGINIILYLSHIYPFIQWISFIG